MVTMATDRIPLGRFSLITRLSPKALRRYYDELGLLVPGTKDICTGVPLLHDCADSPAESRSRRLCTLGFFPN